MKADRRTLWQALALFLFAFGFRLIGIGWGLPNDLHNQSLHPDETIVLNNFAYRIEPGQGKFTPENYNYPTLYPLLLRVAGDMATTYSGAENPKHTPQPSLSEYLDKMGRFERTVNLAGRIVSALAGAGTAVIVFLFLLRFTGQIGAVFGGALMAIAPAFLVHSRFQTVDVTSTFFFTVAIYYAAKLLSVPGEDHDPRDVKRYARIVLLSALFAGLSAGTKYTGVLALLALWTALFIGRHPQRFRLAASALLVAVGAFLITTPGALLDTAQFLKGVRTETAHMGEGHGFVFVGTPNGFLFHLGNVVTGIGPLAALIGLAGLFWAAAKKHAWAWLLLVTFIPYYILIGRSEVKFMRYVLPLFPAVCCGFGYAIAAAYRRPRLRYASLAVGAIALLGLDSFAFTAVEKKTYASCLDLRYGGLHGALKYTWNMVNEHPQDEAARYIKSLAAAGQIRTVGLYRRPWFWTVPVIKDANYLNTREPLWGELFSKATTPRVQFAVMRPPADRVTWTAFEVDPIRRAIQHPSEVPEEFKDDFAALAPLLKDLDQKYVVDKTFGGDVPEIEDLMYIHPRVEVLRPK
ncbi:MAG: hypothetical protein QOJ65_844 [Fimbriimonadaceae bacterium]|jgi:hypothetical protein|nr:hypothetical protein [Fimbriimonadaceae bacterium]